MGNLGSNQNFPDLQAQAQAQANATAQSLANAYVPSPRDPRKKLKALRALFEEKAREASVPPSTRSDDRTDLQKIRAFYSDGAYRHYAPRIMFDVVISEAKAAQDAGTAVGQLFSQWNERYKLRNDLHPIAKVLSAAGFKTAIGEWREWNAGLMPEGLFPGDKGM